MLGVVILVDMLADFRYADCRSFITRAGIIKTLQIRNLLIT